MTANVNNKNRRYSSDNILPLLKAQIDNSLDLGWAVDDMILIANVPFEYRSVKATEIDLNKFCLTGSKIFAVKYLLDNGMDDVIWAHDLDAWQNHWFECPDFADVGACFYSRPKFNGGSVFWKPSAKDILEEIAEILQKNKHEREEPTLDKVFKKHPNRVTTLNSTYNVGCSGYFERYTESIKPLRVCHFHPYNTTAWETHCLDRNGLNDKGISDRLENLLRKYYPNLAKELSPKGKLAQKEKPIMRQEKAARHLAKSFVEEEKKDDSTTYFLELKKSMEFLAQDEQTIFIGYNIKNFYRANGTLKDVSDDKIIETPVAENLMVGLGIGMSLEGYKPLIFFERFDFVLNALDAIVNHLNKLKSISDGHFDPKVIIRIVVGKKQFPLYSGCTHTQDFTEQIKTMVDFPVIKLTKKEDIFDTYIKAYKSKDSYIIVEENDLYAT